MAKTEIWIGKLPKSQEEENVLTGERNFDGYAFESLRDDINQGRTDKKVKVTNFNTAVHWNLFPNKLHGLPFSYKFVDIILPRYVTTKMHIISVTLS